MWSRKQKDHPHRESQSRAPQQAEERLRAAERRLMRGRLGQAAGQALELALERPYDLAYINRIGDLLVRANEIASGIALFERVGQAYAAEGFWAKAIAIYKKILRYDPLRSDIEAQVAFLCQRSGLPTGVGST